MDTNLNSTIQYGILSGTADFPSESVRLFIPWVLLVTLTEEILCPP